MPDQPGNKRTDNEKKTDWQGDLITTDMHSVNNTKLLYFICWQDWKNVTHFFFLHQHLQQFHEPIPTAQSYLNFFLEIFDTWTKNISHKRYNHKRYNIRV